MEFLDAKCPSCGGELKVPIDRSTIKCMYCGCDILVRDAIAKGGVDPANLLALANTFLEQENPEKADEYFDRVLENDPRNIDAWLGKYQARTLKNPHPYLIEDEYIEYNDRARILVTCINLTDKCDIDKFILLLCNINNKVMMHFTANGAMEALRDILKDEHDKTYKSIIYYKYEAVRLANELTNIWSYIKNDGSLATDRMHIEIEYLNKYLGIIREVEPEYNTPLDEAAISYIKENVTGVDISNI